ncbi:hypothetical protein BRADI_4g13465v3 [Brachypodium distachyon]|uniref:Uncharacterized protein n=1 Tax=Brachypodium distachyon TaxID=15368 RepID=A0A0Q3EJ73_BRADI|nr:hypothetical protein BRADI_4g13465v3 [Brachypodium distachyon]
MTKSHQAQHADAVRERERERERGSRIPPGPCVLRVSRGRRRRPPQSAAATLTASRTPPPRPPIAKPSQTRPAAPSGPARGSRSPPAWPWARRPAVLPPCPGAPPTRRLQLPIPNLLRSIAAVQHIHTRERGTSVRACYAKKESQTKKRPSAMKVATWICRQGQPHERSKLCRRPGLQ